MALSKIYLGNTLIIDGNIIAAAIGSEASSAQNFIDLVNIINTNKTNLANNLTSKGVSSLSSLTLSDLVANVLNVPVNDPAPIITAIGSEVASNATINQIASTLSSDKQALIDLLAGYGIVKTTNNTLIDIINGINSIIGTRFRYASENLSNSSFLNSVTLSDVLSALLVSLFLTTPSENLQDGSFLPSTLSDANLVASAYYLISLIMTANNAGSSLNLLPTMSTNTYPFGTASSSGDNNANNLPWKAFNGTTTADSGLDCWRSNTTDSGWLSYNFISSTIVNKYDVISTNQATVGINEFPKNFTFEGSNDGNNWTVLDTQTNQTISSVPTTKTYSFSNTTSYTYYRINVTAVGTTSNYVSIGELKMYNTNSGTVSASTIYSSTFDAWKAFNTTVTDANDGWKTVAGTLTGWLKFQPISSVAVNRYDLLPLNDSTNGTNSFPKNWTFEGSNDGNNWTVLDTQTNQSVSSYTGVIKYYTFSNSTSYSYYRINITANNGNVSYTSIGDIRMYRNGY